jgi:nucleoid DNA-binding protein
MNENIIKNKMISIIHNKLNKEVSKIIINDSINIINDYLAQELIENKSVSIDKFGTLSPYKQFDKINIKLRPHFAFKTLIDRKKKSFQK